MFTVSTTVNDVVQALIDFLRPVVQNVPIIRAQTNRTTYPVADFVLLTERNQQNVAVSSVQYNEPDGSASIYNAPIIEVQIDFYGVNSGDFCRAVEMAFRTSYACSQFPNTVRPLYCSQGMQAPLINAELQYQSRWVLSAYLQYNPALKVPQQYPNELKVNEFVNVDTTIG